MKSKIRIGDAALVTGGRPTGTIDPQTLVDPARHAGGAHAALERAGGEYEACALLDSMRFRGMWHFECRDVAGAVRWRAQAGNLVVNVGLDDILDKYFRSSGYTAAHFIGLMSGSPTVAPTDTMASHPGWSEPTNYTEANRPNFTPGTVSAQSINNFAAPATFSINGSGVIGGGFTTTDGTKAGTLGTLYNAVAFVEGNKSVSDGDTLTVRMSLSSSA